ASSSAVPMSPTRRASPAMSRADSIRQIASMARCALVGAVSARPVPPGATPYRAAMVRAPSRDLVHRDLTDLEGPAVVGCPLEPFDGLVHRAHRPPPVPGHQLLGLRERPVDHGALLAVELNTLSLPARGEAASRDDHPRLDQLFVELLVLRHSRRRRGGRRLAPLAF